MLFNNINQSVKNYVQDYFVNTVKNSSKLDLEYLSFLYLINNTRIDGPKPKGGHNQSWTNRFLLDYDNYYNSPKYNFGELTENKNPIIKPDKLINSISVRDKAKQYYKAYKWVIEPSSPGLSLSSFNNWHTYDKKYEIWFNKFEDSYYYLLHLLNQRSAAFSGKGLIYGPSEVKHENFDWQLFNEIEYPYKVENINIAKTTGQTTINFEITDVFNEYARYRLFFNKPKFIFTSKNSFLYELKIVKEFKPMKYGKFLEMLRNNKAKNAKTKQFSFDINKYIVDMFLDYKKVFYIYSTEARLFNVKDEFNVDNIYKLVEQHNVQTKSDEDIILFSS